MTSLEKYIIARWCYAIGEDYMDDVEYGYLHAKMKEEYPDNEYVNRSWSDDPCPLDLLKKYNLMEYYRDIKFAHRSESIESINSETMVEELFRGLNERSRLSYKLDGFNIQMNYYNGSIISCETRGRTGNSLNANVLLRLVPPRIPFKGKVKVTGECVMRRDKWNEFQLMTGNTVERNSISTVMAEGLTDYAAFIAFNIQTDEDIINRDIYDVLTDCGFTVPQHVYIENYTQLMKAITLLGKRSKVYNFATDGLVLENSKYQLAIRIGEWKEEICKSYVTGYDENVGIYNNPVIIKIKPVRVNGAIRREVAITNLQRVIDNNLKIGTPIAFDIRSQTIAVINTTATEDLQYKYAGKFDKYREEIDSISEEV